MTDERPPTTAAPTTPNRKLGWVVGTDGSTGARNAATWAARNADGRTESVVVAAVWSIPTVPTIALPGAGPPAFDIDDLRRSTATTVDEIVAHIGKELDAASSTGVVGPDARVDVSGMVLEGSTASALLDASHDASLLVLGSRGHGGFSRLILGSTSSQCATHAVRPTVIVPPGAPPVAAKRISVAVDGSANSLVALAWAQQFATPDSVVDVVTVRNLAPGLMGIDAFAGPADRDQVEHWFDELVDRAEREENTRRGGGPSPQLVRHVVDGDPRTELALIAETGDLLVVGARGHGAIGTAILGSVSTWLIHHVTRPVVVVPGTEE